MSPERLRALLPEVWALMRPRRRLLALAFVLMAVSRVAGLVLPVSTRFFIDDVIGHGRVEWLLPLVAGVLGATAVQGLSAYALVQLVSKAAQRLIAEMRIKVQEHVGRLPVAFHDATRSGDLVSRIMNDVEGFRNLIGTGLVELSGGLVTASLAFAVMLRLSAPVTLLTLVAIAAFALVVYRAVKLLGPIFRERGKIYAEVTGRLTESLAGVRVVKAYEAEKREAAVFAAGVGAHPRQRVPDPGGNVAAVARLDAAAGRRGRRCPVRRRERDPGRPHERGLVLHLHGAARLPGGAAAPDRHDRVAAERGARRARPHARAARRAARGRRPAPHASSSRTLRGDVAFEDVGFAYREGEPVLGGISLVAEARHASPLSSGPSGAGKSTLIGLVCAFHAPSSGRVLVDGVDLAT